MAVPWYKIPLPIGLTLDDLGVCAIREVIVFLTLVNNFYSKQTVSVLRMWILHIRNKQTGCICNYIHKCMSIFTPFQFWLQLVVFHLKGDFLSNLVLILIILNLSLWVLYNTVKLWNAHFGTTLGCSFTCYQRQFNLLKSSLWICHLKMIKMYRNLDRKSPFTYAATWWSSTLESSEFQTNLSELLELF